jgi:hypothetical protein
MFNPLATRPGRAEEAEAVYREAIKAEDDGAWRDLGILPATQPGREEEAEGARCARRL